MPDQNRYSALIEAVFFLRYKPDIPDVFFERQDIIDKAQELGIALPKNVGDVVYSFRYRTPLPRSIRDIAPLGMEWVIFGNGRGKYRFSPADPKLARILPNSNLIETKIPEATPGLVLKYTGTDEQALLAKVRYNRLIDIFTGVTAFSLQNHLRTTVPDVGQVETDEIYVGVDKKGAHYVFPVQAKGHSDQLGIAQVDQDFLVGETKYPGLICCPISAQFMADDVIAMFSFEKTDNEIRISGERHYKLVAPEDVTSVDLE